MFDAVALGYFSAVFRSRDRQAVVKCLLDQYTSLFQPSFDDSLAQARGYFNYLSVPKTYLASAKVAADLVTQALHMLMQLSEWEPFIRSIHRDHLGVCKVSLHSDW